MVEIPPFPDQADKVWSEEEREVFINFISSNPLAGQEIPGSEGVRKIRWRQRGKGKRGGVRVIYFFYNLKFPLFLLNVYPKAEKDDLTPAQKKQITQFVKTLKAKLKAKFKEARHE